MTPEEKITNLEYLAKDFLSKANILRDARDLFVNGYQSDQAIIDKGIVDGVAAQILQATASLQKQLDEATQAIKDLQSEIAVLTT